MRDINLCATWDTKVIPMACCSEVGYALCGDWALPNPATDPMPDQWWREYIPWRLGSLGVPLTTSAVLMMDWENPATPPYQAYPSMLDIAREVLPNATLAVWIGSEYGAASMSAEMLASLRRGRAALCPCIYQQRRESPAEAQMDVRRVVEGCFVAAPGVAIIPCIGLGVGWLHPDYPPGTDGLEPLCSLENLLARRAAVAGLAADLKITACAWWQSARIGDAKRVAALSWIGNKIRTRVAMMRADANVPVIVPAGV